MTNEASLSDLKKLRDELTDFEQRTGTSVLAYSPCCPDCEKEDIYNPGCFHEKEQAWVCCTQRRNPGCGRVILTVAEFNAKRNRQSQRHSEVQ